MKFSDQVNSHADKYRRRLLAVFRQSVQETIHSANVPVGQGGKMRVDTGFLRNSGQASLDRMPSGPGKGGARAYRSQVAGEPIEIVIRKAELGDTIWFGWTANYARIREYHDGFLRSAVQRWDKTVGDVALRVQRLS